MFNADYAPKRVGCKLGGPTRRDVGNGHEQRPPPFIIQILRSLDSQGPCDFGGRIDARIVL